MALRTADQRAEIQRYAEQGQAELARHEGWAEVYKDKIAAKRRRLTVLLAGRIYARLKDTSRFEIEFLGWEVAPGQICFAAGVLTMVLIVIGPRLTSENACPGIVFGTAGICALAGFIATSWLRSVPQLYSGELGRMGPGYGSLAALLGGWGGFLAGSVRGAFAWRAARRARARPDTPEIT